MKHDSVRFQHRARGQMKCAGHYPRPPACVLLPEHCTSSVWIAEDEMLSARFKFVYLERKGDGGPAYCEKARYIPRDSCPWILGCSTSGYACPDRRQSLNGAPPGPPYPNGGILQSPEQMEPSPQPLLFLSPEPTHPPLPPRPTHRLQPREVRQWAPSRILKGSKGRKSASSEVRKFLCTPKIVLYPLFRAGNPRFRQLEAP